MSLTINFDGKTISLTEHALGGKAYVYLGSDNMIYYLLDDEFAFEKEFLVMANKGNNIHIPDIRHVGTTLHNGFRYEVFRSPLYYKKNAQNMALAKKIEKDVLYYGGLPIERTLSHSMIGKYPQSIIDAIRTFEQVAIDNDLEDVEWDMHIHNMMQDELGNLIFIDPIQVFETNSYEDESDE